MKRAVAAVAACTLAVAVLMATATPASAHPLGNFSVNQFAELTVGRDAVAVHMVVDLAEIPTFQARGELDVDGDGTVAAAELSRYASSTCRTVADAAVMTIGGSPAPVSVASAQAAFGPGSADLPVLRIDCRGRAVNTDLGGDGATAVTFRTTAFADRVGWREVVARGDEMRLVRSTVPAASVSGGLRSYPEDQLSSPLDVRSARLTVTPGGAAAAVTTNDNAVGRALPRQLDAATSRLTGLVTGELTLGLALAALGLALVLGALHAFAPGHGKTVIAAYLVAERGTLRQAALIGLCVTVTHTAGVLVLGIVLSTWSAFAPDRLYPVLGIVSGLLLAWIGLVLVGRAIARRRSSAAHSHHHHEHSDREHDHHHDHDHDPDLHQHGGSWHRHPEITVDTKIGWRSLALMGVAGGLVPSPSALVVLLAATALGRAWFGAVLVVFYGAGMAVTLIAAGLLLTRVRHLFDRNGRAPRLVRAGAFLPVATSSVIVVVGISLATRSLLTL